ncbi:MAG: ubiquinone/menaquinone biosynthesis methyltransferase [Phycisphaerales bacterium]|jgi:demethylmenaquinone methyltransferase/2-methoxy-6-polyprenyl-1,4-benzoquinol methylase|nr:ubiquinone/menaquinone biosynthesis methyltransferase [Phycisphaerales bacterium]
MSGEQPSQTQAAWSAEDLRGNPHEAIDKARRVESMFASIAGRYDLNNRVHSLWRDQVWRRRAAMLARIAPEDDVLDMACGTGDLSEILARCRPRSVLGMDFTEAMLEIAQRKARRKARSNGVPAPTFRWGDAMEIDLPDESVDVVTIAFGLRNISSPQTAVGEFARILRPGGRLVVLEFSTPRNPLVRLLNAAYTQYIMPVTATLLSGDRSGAYRYLPRSVSMFADPAALAKMIAAGGLAVRQQVPQSLGICTITVATR